MGRYRSTVCEKYRRFLSYSQNCGSIKGIKRNINLQFKVTLKIVTECFFFGIWQAQSMWEKSTGSRYKQARLNKQLLCGQHF